MRMIPGNRGTVTLDDCGRGHGCAATNHLVEEGGIQRRNP